MASALPDKIQGSRAAVPMSTLALSGCPGLNRRGYAVKLPSAREFFW